MNVGELKEFLKDKDDDTPVVVPSVDFELQWFDNVEPAGVNYNPMLNAVIIAHKPYFS